MDFDFSTLLYILFAIIYFVFSSGKKKNKKPANKSVPPVVNPEIELEEEFKPPSFEDLLKEFTGQTVIKQPDPKPEPVKPLVTEPAQPRKEITMAYDKIKHSKLEDNYERFDRFKIEEEEGHEDWGGFLKDANGARKAFIYSEIFKRKY